MGKGGEGHWKGWTLKDFLNPEMVTSGTRVLKMTNAPVFYMALGLNDFGAGKSITRPIGRGGPL
jgi:hypothetical protein